MFSGSQGDRPVTIAGQSAKPLEIFQGSAENPGINKRALKHLFSEIEQRKDMWSYTVTVSSVEIYNEVLRYSALC